MNLTELNFNQREEFKVSTSNAVYNCRVLGNGKNFLVAFHGFGQDGKAFLPLVVNSDTHTIYSFDLPFHGNTKIANYAQPITSNEIHELLQRLLDISSIKKFSLMGFSIGAKFIFPLIAKYHSNIQHVWLLAPDGISANFWYGLATKTQIMRNIFYYVISHQSALKNVGSGLRSLRLIDGNTFTFALKSINSERKRQQVYHTWIYLRKLKIDIKLISKMILDDKIHVYFILGKYDKVITKSDIRPLHEKLPDSHVIELLCGHQNLIENYSERFTEYMH